MNVAQLADFMVTGGYNDSLETYANRLAMRLFSYPSVMLSLQGMRMVEAETNKNERNKDHVELIFRAIPADMLETVKAVIGNDDPMDAYAFRGKNDAPMLGIRVYPRKVGAMRKEQPV